MNPDFFVDNIRYLMVFRNCTALLPISGEGGVEM